MHVAKCGRSVCVVPGEMATLNKSLFFWERVVRHDNLKFSTTKIWG